MFVLLNMYVFGFLLQISIYFLFFPLAPLTPMLNSLRWWLFAAAAAAAVVVVVVVVVNVIVARHTSVAVFAYLCSICFFFIFQSAFYGCPHIGFRVEIA